MWSVGTSMASESRELSACVVCRDKYGEWVKGIVDGVWFVGTSMASGSRGLSACVVCRGEKGEWVKRTVAGMWSVGTSMASGSKELSTECGLSGQVWRVSQGNCRRSVVCRDKYGEWVKRPVTGMWSVGTSMASGSRELSAGVVCRVKYGEWVKGIVGGVWSVGTSMASGSRELLLESGLLV